MGTGEQCATGEQSRPRELGTGLSSRGTSSQSQAGQNNNRGETRHQEQDKIHKQAQSNYFNSSISISMLIVAMHVFYLQFNFQYWYIPTALIG